MSETIKKTEIALQSFIRISEFRNIHALIIFYNKKPSLSTPHVSIKQENAGMGYNISHIKPFFQWKLARHITYFITKEDSAEPTGLLGNPCY